MLKVVLYVFAVLGLLASPVRAEIAHLDCGAMVQTMSAMADMSGKMDCCDQKAKPEKSKSCESNCAAMCGITAAADAYVAYQSPFLVTARSHFSMAGAAAPSHILRYTDPPPRLQA